MTWPDLAICSQKVKQGCSKGYGKFQSTMRNISASIQGKPQWGCTKSPPLMRIKKHRVLGTRLHHDSQMPVNSYVWSIITIACMKLTCSILGNIPIFSHRMNVFPSFVDSLEYSSCRHTWTHPNMVKSKKQSRNVGKATGGAPYSEACWTWGWNIAQCQCSAKSSALHSAAWKIAHYTG